MTRPTLASIVRRPSLALAASLLLALPLAHAAGLRAVDASAVPFAEGVAAAGIDLAWDGGLIVVLGAAGTGELGDLAVPTYDPATLPTDAFGHVLVDQALTRIGLELDYPGGMTFVQNGANAETVAAAYADRLAALGFDVDHQAGARTFTFARDGVSYRAVFGAAENGVRVYLGL